MRFIVFKYDKNFGDNKKKWNIRGVFDNVEEISKHIEMFVDDGEHDEKVFKIQAWKKASIQQWIFNISFNNFKHLIFDEKTYKFKIGE